jgi:hypothetical protein
MDAPPWKAALYAAMQKEASEGVSVFFGDTDAVCPAAARKEEIRRIIALAPAKEELRYFVEDIIDKTHDYHRRLLGASFFFLIHLLECIRM